MVEVPLLQGRDGEPVEPPARLGLDPVGERRERGRRGVAIDRIGFLGLALQRVDQ